MENLNLFYLKCFLDAVLMGSISESARRNFVSQSAVSQAIKKLEDTLKVTLSTHRKQQFELTAAGKIVYKKAEEIFSTVRSLYDALDHHQKQPRTPLHFVTTHSIGLSLLPNYLARFRHDYPQIDIHFQFGGLTQIKAWLKQGIAEFALVLESPHLDYQSFPIHKGNFNIYKHRNESQDIDQVGVYVENRKELMVSKLEDSYLKQYKRPLLISLEMNNWEFIARTMEKEKGYGFLPDFISFDHRNSHLIPFSNSTLSYSLNAIFLKGKTLSYSASTFLNLFTQFVSSGFSCLEK